MACVMRRSSVVAVLYGACVAKERDDDACAEWIWLAHRRRLALVTRPEIPAHVPPLRQNSLTVITCDDATSFGQETAGLSRPVITGMCIHGCSRATVGISGGGAPDTLAVCYSIKDLDRLVGTGRRAGTALLFIRWKTRVKVTCRRLLI